MLKADAIEALKEIAAVDYRDHAQLKSGVSTHGLQHQDTRRDERGGPSVQPPKISFIGDEQIWRTVKRLIRRLCCTARRGQVVEICVLGYMSG